MKILILEDDSALRFALTTVLEDDGHIVLATGDLAGAATFLETEIPDILLLDLLIGKNSSLEIADLAGYRAPNAEVIYLTGSNKFPNGELLEISKNASWVLRKPVDFFELKAMIAHVGQTAKSAKPVSKDELQRWKSNG